MTEAPLRVLQALTTGGTGGTERMVAALVEGLSSRSIVSEVSVLEPGGVTDGIDAGGVPVHALGGTGSYVGAARRLAMRLSTGKYDVMHVYGFRMSLVARAAVQVMRGPRPRVVLGIRGLHLGDWEDAASARTRIAVWIERAAGRWVDVYAANSRAAVDFLTARGLPAGKFHVVPNGIDTRYWAPGRDSRRDGSILAVANLRPVKRPDLLVDAAGVLAQTHGPRLRVLLAGEGPLRLTLERQIVARGLTGRVVLAGATSRAQTRDLMRAASICVLTSRWEGMPVSLLEAMACECPVVATDVPGIRDLVTHQVEGLLVASTADAIAAACARLLDDSALGSRLGSAGRRLVDGRYAVDRMVDAHAALYATLAGRA